MSEGSLGEFVREFEYEGATFYVRGLTVAEHIDLVEKREGSITDTMYVDIALQTIQGWEDLYPSVENQSEVDEYEYEDGNEQNLDLVTLAEIGQFVYKELTILSDEEEKKIKGFVNFLYWKSEDKNKGRAKYFDCENCLKSGRALGKPCGRFSMETRREYARQESSSKGQKKKSKTKSQGKSKYASSKTYTSEEELKDSNKQQSKDFMVLNDFKFPECPVSWIDSHLKMLCETLYHAEKSDRNFFDGGIADQPYKVYKASVIIKNEYNTLEQEKMEEKRQKNS